MSGEDAHFSVDTRLTRLLGETYRSSETALKELVDNAWDADAAHVWISPPGAMSGDPIVVRDDGTGMTPQVLRDEYLKIASDKRRRTGDRTRRLNRKVKGRKGIGKFAGLTIAAKMQVTSVARGRRCGILIDKDALLNTEGDLEAVPLPFLDEPVAQAAAGTPSSPTAWWRAYEPPATRWRGGRRWKSTAKSPGPTADGDIRNTAAFPALGRERSFRPSRAAAA